MIARKNCIHINISFNIVLGKCYYLDNEFCVILMDNYSMIPYRSKKICDCVNWLYDNISSYDGEIHIMVNYPNNISKKKKQKIKQLVELTDFNKTILTKYISILK